MLDSLQAAAHSAGAPDSSGCGDLAQKSRSSFMSRQPFALGAVQFSGGCSPARHRLRAPATDEARLVTMVPLNMFERTDLHAVETTFAAGCPDPDSSQFAGESLL